MLLGHQSSVTCGPGAGPGSRYRSLAFVICGSPVPVLLCGCGWRWQPLFRHLVLTVSACQPWQKPGCGDRARCGCDHTTRRSRPKPRIRACGISQVLAQHPLGLLDRRHRRRKRHGRAGADASARLFASTALRTPSRAGSAPRQATIGGRAR